MPLASIWVVVGAYLLGSIPVGYLLVRIFRKQDIRSVGSGNIGTTNVMRSSGKGLGLATFVLDVLKGAGAVYLGGVLGTWFAPTMTVASMQALAAFAAVLGHVFPVWLGFRGGKGVATGFGVFLVAAPVAALLAIALFAIVLALCRFVSLSSIVAAISFPVLAWFTARSHSAFVFAIELAVALLIIAKHHQNIGRLLSGTENRIGAGKAA